MIKIGITGIIGSGKTTVSKIFETMGIPVFNADEIAKTYYLEKGVKEQVIKYFGKNILSEDGSVNLGKLSQIVFTDPGKLKVLNNLIHPRVRQDLKIWFIKNKDKKIVVYESALLFESGLDEDMDYSITVSSPVEISIDRVMKRSQLSEPEILSRMKNQYSDSQKSKHADFIILNDEKNLLIPQVLKVLDKIKVKNLP